MKVTPRGYVVDALFLVLMPRWLAGALALVLASAWPLSAPAHDSAEGGERLPLMGTAPGFRLTTHDGASLALRDLRGKVVVVNFIYTRCADVCPLLTHQLVQVQDALGDEFGRRVHFVSISVDPEQDRPDTLRQYADALGCNLNGWTFLTGTKSKVQRVSHDYGVYFERQTGGDVGHNLLTSIIDQTGALRVQYIGYRFDVAEFLHDLRGVLAEGPS